MTQGEEPPKTYAPPFYMMDTYAARSLVMSLVHSMTLCNIAKYDIGDCVDGPDAPRT